ncbi:MAG: hypothetical protein HPY65_12715 [Syntrophaceae bacterium]|nr:hypothetical protein [Syntrophaceae bacterium]
MNGTYSNTAGKGIHRKGHIMSIGHRQEHLSTRRKHIFAFVSLFTFILIIYGNSFHGAWQFDDFDNIVNNPQIRTNELTKGSGKQTFSPIHYLILSRPVAKLSFALNYSLGGLNVFGYHLLNLIIHFTASFFLYLLLYNTLNLPLLKKSYGYLSYEIALLAMFLWASSPVNVNAVTYIVQRMTSLAGMGYVLSMYFYLKARTSEGRVWKIAFFLICAITGCLAIGSKENAATLPVSIFIYDLFLIQGTTFENIKKHTPIIILFLTMVISGTVYLLFFTPIVDYQYWTFTMGERLLTEPRVFLFYISLLLYPVHSRLALDHDFQISRSFLEPWSTLPAILIILFLLFYAFRMSKRHPLLSFCILFFFLNHLIEGTIIPLDLVFEHRNYIPSMFFFVPFAIIITKAFHHFSYRKSLQLVIFCFMTFILVTQGYTVSARNEVFKSPDSLWKDSALKSPFLSRPRASLGFIYAGQGNFQKAIEEIETALQLSRYADLEQLVLYHVSLGSFYFVANYKDDLSLSHYEKALEISPRIASPLVYHNMAFIMLNRGNLGKAHEYGEKAISYAPNNELAHSNFARILLKEGKLKEAINEASRALSIHPDFPASLAVLGEAYRLNGNYERSEHYWEEFIKFDPTNIPAFLALLELSHLQGKKDKSAALIKKLLVLSQGKSILEVLKQSNVKNFPYTPDPRIISMLFQKYHKINNPENTGS